MATTTSSNLYGLLAKFETPEALVAATKRVYEAGYRKLDAYSPYPVDGLSEAMRMKPSLIPYIILAGGVIGGVTGFGMQAFANVIAYPLNIGGRPPFSWPAYIPITFELIILMAAVSGFLALFFFSRFPQPYHPVFRSDDFNRHASQDAFYLSIEAADPQFDLQKTRRFMEESGSVLVSEIEA